MAEDWLEIAATNHPYLYEEYRQIWPDDQQAEDMLRQVVALYLQQYDFCPGLAPQPRTKEATRAALASLLTVPVPAKPEVGA